MLPGRAHADSRPCARPSLAEAAENALALSRNLLIEQSCGAIQVGSCPGSRSNGACWKELSVSAAALTAPEQRGRPFQPGQSGNPTGRPPGSKNKLAEAFLRELASD